MYPIATSENLQIFFFPKDREDQEKIDEAKKLNDCLDKYFSVFLFTDGKCPGCEEGLSHTFRWGLARGEGQCSGCGWPCRAYHDPKDEFKEKLLTSLFVLILPYDCQVKEHDD